MLGRKDYTQEELTSCKVAIGAQLEAYNGLRAAVGCSNVVVHGYADVDVRIVRDVLTNRLDDLTAFVAAIRARL